MPHSGIECEVTGRVQGVCFRSATETEARRLGLTGWVHNTQHGTVTLKAFGPKDQLDQLLEWLQHGPPAAAVNQVNWESIPHETYDTFSITY